MFKRIFFVLVIFMGIAEAKDFLKVLDAMQLTQKERVAIKVVLEDYHQERKVYYKNINRTEELMFSELFQGRVVDFEKYKAILEEINEDYVEAQIKFYKLLSKKLGKERMQQLAQEILK